MIKINILLLKFPHIVYYTIRHQVLIHYIELRHPEKIKILEKSPVFQQRNRQCAETQCAPDPESLAEYRNWFKSTKTSGLHT